jgi:hypothetical protein
MIGTDDARPRDSKRNGSFSSLSFEEEDVVGNTRTAEFKELLVVDDDDVKPRGETIGFAIVDPPVIADLANAPNAEVIFACSAGTARQASAPFSSISMLSAAKPAVDSKAALATQTSALRRARGTSVKSAS